MKRDDRAAMLASTSSCSIGCISGPKTKKKRAKELMNVYKASGKKSKVVIKVIERGRD